MPPEKDSRTIIYDICSDETHKSCSTGFKIVSLKPNLNRCSLFRLVTKLFFGLVSNVFADGGWLDRQRAWGRQPVNFRSKEIVLDQVDFSLRQIEHGANVEVNS